MKRGPLAGWILIVAGSLVGFALSLFADWLRFEAISGREPQVLLGTTTGAYVADSVSLSPGMWGDSVVFVDGEPVRASERAGAEIQFEWSTSDSSVAVVDSDGRVSPVGPGTAIIRVRANGFEDSAVVVVKSSNDADATSSSRTEDSIGDRNRAPESRATDRRGGSPPPAPVQINVVEPERTWKDFFGEAILKIIGAGANLIVLLVLLWLADRRDVKLSDLRDLLG
jgi:hypothetical protein